MIRTLRSFFTYCICLSVALPATAQPSAAFTPERTLSTVRKVIFESKPKAFQVLRNTGVSIESTQSTLKGLAASKSAEMSGHVGQTLLFILAVTGIEIVKGELQHRGQAKPSDEDILTLIYEATTQVLNNSGTYMSLIGAGAAELGSRYPVKVLTTWIADASARPILHKALRMTMGAIVANGGWDFGAQLNAEAAMLLDTPEEYERIQNLFGTATGALTALLSSGSERDQADLALVQKMARNVFYVALVDQDLRSAWIDNTLRTRIMTGEFTVLSAALAAAAVGTMVLPGGGTVAGFIIGVVAVTVAINIPQEIKNSITKGFQAIRRKLLYDRMVGYDMQIATITRRWELPWQSVDFKPTRIAKIIEYRQRTRSSLITVELERMRMVLHELFASKDEDLTAYAREKVRKYAGSLQKMFAHELEAIDQTLAGIPEGASSQIAVVLSAERARVSTLASFFLQLSVELDSVFDRNPGARTFAAFDSRAQEFIKFIEVSYARGFREEQLL